MDISVELGKLMAKIDGIQVNMNDRFSSTEKLFNEKLNPIQQSLIITEQEHNKNSERISALELIISNWTSSWKTVLALVSISGGVIAFFVTIIMGWIKG